MGVRESARASTVLAIAGLAREARIAAGSGVETIQAGGNPQRLRERLDRHSAETFGGVISFGIAGGLDPSLAPGDVVLGTGVVADRRWACDPRITEAHAQLLAPLGRIVRIGEIAGVDAAVLTPEAKAALRARTGAAAVDMESQVAAAFAARHGLPFGILRVVCDPAERSLPAFAATALKPDGEPDLMAILSAIGRRPVRLGALLVLARDSGAAFRSLGRARALLGLALGVDA